MGKPVLLLVEDDPFIADLIEIALIDGGYEVVWSENGSAALCAFDNRSSEVAALITDIRLGCGPDGWNVARYARELRPELPVVYMTGDSAADWSNNGVSNSILIEKPFLPDRLLAAISALLVAPNGRCARAG